MAINLNNSAVNSSHTVCKHIYFNLDVHRYTYTLPRWKLINLSEHIDAEEVKKSTELISTQSW